MRDGGRSPLSSPGNGHHIIPEHLGSAAMARSRSVDEFLKSTADETAVRAGFWPKVARVAGQLPFSEDLL